MTLLRLYTAAGLGLRAEVKYNNAYVDSQDCCVEYGESGGWEMFERGDSVSGQRYRRKKFWRRRIRRVYKNYHVRRTLLPHC